MAGEAEVAEFVASGGDGTTVIDMESIRLAVAVLCR
jgi:hypothetical protein